MIKGLARGTIALVFFICALSVWWGCGERGFGETTSGTIHATPSQIAFSLVPIGESAEETLRLMNTSDEELRLFQIELVASGSGRIKELELLDKPTLPHALDAGEFVDLRVRYSPTEAGNNSGEVQVVSSDPSYSSEDPLVIPVRTLANRPELFIDPPQVRFQRLQPGQNATRVLQLSNVGSAPLILNEEPSYSGGEDFRVQVEARNYPLRLQPYDAEKAEESPADYLLDVTVHYRPLGGGFDSGEVLVDTNDNKGTHLIPVRADADSPCIEVDRRVRNMGQVPIGGSSADRVEVRNCGSQVLEIDGVFFEEEDAVFRLDLGSWDRNGDGQIDAGAPVRLSPGESDGFNIRFVPVEERTSRTKVLITSNDPIQPQLALDVTARGAEGSCPTAVALASVRGVGGTARPSITAVPLQTVLLDGSQSSTETGEVVGWHWEVLERPPGTTVNLKPAQGDPLDQDSSKREFQPLIAGDYRFELSVENDSGFQSCESAEVLIRAIPDQDLHIELVWTNPEDDDETDDFGSDVDLHLVKMGPGVWFDSIYSVYYGHPNRSQDNIWEPEDPSLDIDVRDGMGPENITMRNPDGCQWYAVGVHYYQERFGTAYATVRIYVQGDLRYERPYFPLERTRNFWDVARIHWDSASAAATIIEVDELYPMEPTGEPPRVTSQMRESGRCTAQGLY